MLIPKSDGTIVYSQKLVTISYYFLEMYSLQIGPLRQVQGLKGTVPLFRALMNRTLLGLLSLIYFSFFQKIYKNFCFLQVFTEQFLNSGSFEKVVFSLGSFFQQPDLKP